MKKLLGIPITYQFLSLIGKLIGSGLVSLVTFFASRYQGTTDPTEIND